MPDPTITVTLTREEAEGLLTYSRGNPDGDECGPGCDACAARAKLRQALDSPQPEGAAPSEAAAEFVRRAEQLESLTSPGNLMAKTYRDAAEFLTATLDSPQPERYTVEEVAAKLKSRHLAEEVADAWTEGEEGLHPDFVQQLLMSVLDSDEWAAAFPDQQPVEDCEHCGGSGHDAIPGPTGEPISQGPCRICEGSGLVPKEDEQPEQEGEAGDCPEEVWVLRKGKRRGGPWQAHVSRPIPDYEDGSVRRYVPAPAQHPAENCPEHGDLCGRPNWTGYCRWRAERVKGQPEDYYDALSAAESRIDELEAQHPTGLSEVEDRDTTLSVYRAALERIAADVPEVGTGTGELRTVYPFGAKAALEAREALAEAPEAHASSADQQRRD